MSYCVVTPCSVVVAYQHFGGPCCLHLEPSPPRKYEFSHSEGLSINSVILHYTSGQGKLIGNVFIQRCELCIT